MQQVETFWKRFFSDSICLYFTQHLGCTFFFHFCVFNASQYVITLIVASFSCFLSLYGIPNKSCEGCDFESVNSEGKETIHITKETPGYTRVIWLELLSFIHILRIGLIQMHST